MKTILIFLTALLGMGSCKNKQAHQGHEAHGTKTYYTCSMDPQVMESKPGKCPICHMELTPISVDQLNSNGLKLSEDQVHLANIKTSQVKYGDIKTAVFASGSVKENQNQIRFLNARLDGRIERLYIKAKGATVKKGDIMYLLYSEMLASAQSDFIRNNKMLTEETDNELLRTIQKSALNKLLLWGLSEEQIKELKKLDRPPVPYPILSPISGVVKDVNVSEGSTVMEGAKLFEISEYKSFWVEAQFYPEETSKVMEGSKVKVLIQGTGISREGKVVQILPQLSTNSLVSVVRIQIVNGSADVRPGMQANVAWSSEGRKVLIISTKAVLRASQGNMVWVRNKEGFYEPKMVHLGDVLGKNVEVLHGLKEGEEVIISGAYLLQSEYVFRKGTEAMSGHNM